MIILGTKSYDKKPTKHMTLTTITSLTTITTDDNPRYKKL